MSGWTAKRFWTDVHVEATETGFTVRLDERPVRTPAKALLVVPTRALAEAIATEWRSQYGVIDVLSMPCTRSANAAIDKVAVQLAEVVDLIAAYGGTDLICYRSVGPTELVERQAAAWDPLIEWAARELAAPLVATTGVMHIAQPRKSLAALHRRVALLDHFELTAFHDLVSISGSLVIGFAVISDHLRAEALWQIARIDEIWQAEVWGPDDEAEQAAALKRQDFLHAAKFYRLCED